MTVNYRDYIRSHEWRERSRRAKAAAGWKCQRCGAQHGLGNALELHHRDYSRLGHEEPGDLQVLCRKCHGEIHNLQP